eukprot:TsM_001225300 transcript=TsM_001225300 gene=TsM_001225300
MQRIELVSGGREKARRGESGHDVSGATKGQSVWRLQQSWLGRWGVEVCTDGPESWQQPNVPPAKWQVTCSITVGASTTPLLAFHISTPDPSPSHSYTHSLLPPHHPSHCLHSHR